MDMCFERRSDTVLLKETFSPLPLKIWFFKLRSYNEADFPDRFHQLYIYFHQNKMFL